MIQKVRLSPQTRQEIVPKGSIRKPFFHWPLYDQSFYDNSYRHLVGFRQNAAFRRFHSDFVFLTWKLPPCLILSMIRMECFLWKQWTNARIKNSRVYYILNTASPMRNTVSITERRTKYTWTRINKERKTQAGRRGRRGVVNSRKEHNESQRKLWSS